MVLSSKEKAPTLKVFPRAASALETTTPACGLEVVPPELTRQDTETGMSASTLIPLLLTATPIDWLYIPPLGKSGSKID